MACFKPLSSTVAADAVGSTSPSAARCFPMPAARASVLSAAMLVTVAMLSTPVLAQESGLRNESQITLELANRIAAAGVAACQANGHAVAVTVVDTAGIVRAVQRADRAGPHTIEASRQKAFTSASARNATQAMMEGAQKNPGAANLVHLPGFLLLGGGVPIRAGNVVVGAVGIGGAPGGHLDEQCAMAALEQVKASLQ